MTTMKKLTVLILLFTTTSPTWAEIYDFCQVKKIYDSNVATPPQITHQDCTGVGFLVNGKMLAKAGCWKDANELLEGKCDKPQETVPENTDSKAGMTMPLE